MFGVSYLNNFMKKNNEEMFYFFLTSIYRGEKNIKPMLKKSAKDCIYRVKCIEKIVNYEITKNMIFADSNKIEEIKYLIKLHFFDKNGSRRFAHTPYIFSLNKYKDFYIWSNSTSLVIE